MADARSRRFTDEERAYVKQALHDKIPYIVIINKIGCSRGTVSFYAQKYGLRKFCKNPRLDQSLYDWMAMGEYYNTVFKVKPCLTKFGITISEWRRAVRMGLLKARGRIIEPQNIDTTKSGNRLRKNVLRAAKLPYQCDSCSLPPIWQGVELTLQLDHKDGDSTHNDWDNLRFLCPNCHS